jgi:competence protein ComFC
MDNLLNILFPPKCIGCSKLGKYICENCFKKLATLKQQYCVVCDSISKSGITHKHCATKFTPSASISVFEYTGIIRHCIKNSKYKSKEFQMLKQLITHATDLLLKIPSFYNGYTLLPIPVSKRKYDLRGFNQAEIIASALSNKLSLPIITDYIERIKDTPAQYNYARKDRFINVKDAFKVAQKYLNNPRYLKFLIVDDICTTGATLLEVSTTLYSAGAEDVRCFTLSKRSNVPA